MRKIYSMSEIKSFIAGTIKDRVSKDYVEPLILSPSFEVISLLLQAKRQKIKNHIKGKATKSKSK